MPLAVGLLCRGRVGEVRALLAVDVPWREALAIEQYLVPDEIAARERYRRRRASNRAGWALFLRRRQVGVNQSKGRDRES